MEQELDEELRYHLDHQTEENIAAGMRPEDARYAAMQSIRDMEQRKEECRDMRGWNLAGNLVQDLRYAIRGLRKRPGFSLLVVLVMALGIGANTAVFSVVNGVLLKPLNYREPDRMVTLSNTWNGGAKVRQVALPDFEDWRAQSQAFSSMACYRRSDEPVKAGSSTEYVGVARVSPEFFDVLDTAPMIGRLFSAEEWKSGNSGTALISYAYWQSHFGGGSSVVGQTLRVSDQALVIVGVLPAAIHFPDKTDIWRPLDAVDRTLPRTSMAFYAIGRLKGGISLEQAQSQLASIASRLARQYPGSNKDRRVAAATMRDDLVGDVRITLYLLLGAVSLVLLIACANVATLLLTKASAQTREIAIRAAVGAGRGRIMRQLITESLLLSLVAGAAGLVVALLGSKALVALAPADVPRLGEATIDGRVLVFTFVVSTLCSLLFGLAPALHASRIDLNDALKQGARTVAGGRSGRLRGALVVAEVALSVMLLSGAGLLLKSFAALTHVELGFRPERVLLMKTSLPISGPDSDALARQFFRELLSRVSSLPGVTAAGATMGPPGQVESAGSYWLDHLPQPVVFNGENAVFSVVTPGTFSALGIPIKRGRDFEARDAAGATPTAVINETLARRSFPGQDPIGRLIIAGFDSFRPMKIVGIAGDVRQYGPAKKPDPEIYMPYEQNVSGAGGTLVVVVRTTAVPETLTNTLRRTVHDLSPDVPVRFTTMEASLYEEVAAPRFRTLLLGIFAGLSLCLAIAGVYGVTAYAAGQRSSEIGLRIAMGATPGQVLRLILKHGLALAAAGMALGFPGALGGTRLMASMLFEVTPTDLTTYAGVAVVLGAIVLGASYFPARRTARMDPLSALRED